MHADAILGAWRHQGPSNDCAPYCAAMVLNGLLRAEVDASSLARELDRPRRGGLFGLVPVPRRVPGSATFPWGLVDALRQGSRAAGAELRVGWGALNRRDRLLAGLVRGWVLFPILGGWQPRPWGHVVVLVAWDPRLGYGLADPAAANADTVWLGESEFAKRWRALGNLLVTAQSPGEVGPAAPGAPAAHDPSSIEQRAFRASGRGYRPGD